MHLDNIWKTILFLAIVLSVSYSTLIVTNSNASSVFLGRILTPSSVSPQKVCAGETIIIIVDLNGSTLDTPAFYLKNNFSQVILGKVGVPTINGDIEEFTVRIPEDTLPLLYDLTLEEGSTLLTVWNAVQVIPTGLTNQFSFIHFTDIHINGLDDRTEKVLQLIDEINLIHPDFAIFTGDLIEGYIYPNPSTPADQLPLAIALLQRLEVPVYIINGNHDFWTTGNDVWEQYLAPLDLIVSFTYKNSLFVGTCQEDDNGLRTTQINNILSALKSPADLRFFFVHSDYGNNQFPNLYNSGQIDVCLLGHEHSGNVRTVGSTLEIVTDNSIELNPGEPGHYRLIHVDNGNVTSYEPEIETGHLSAHSEWSYGEGKKQIICKSEINNDLPRSFTNLTQTITVPELWEESTGTNVSNVDLLYNGTHTLVIFQTDVPAMENKSSSVVLIPKIEENSTHSLTSSTSLSITSSDHKTSSGFDLVIFIICVISFLKTKPKKP